MNSQDPNVKGLKLPLYPTPQLIDRARRAMGQIDFDPSSDPVQQTLVQATSVPKVGENPLTMSWHGNVFIAPKGAVKLSRIWLIKTLKEYRRGNIKNFVFFTSATELLRAQPEVWDYPLCIPYRRIRQLQATPDGWRQVSPSTWNFILFGPESDVGLQQVDRIGRFRDCFRDLGRIVLNDYSGDNWQKDLEYLNENKGRLPR